MKVAFTTAIALAILTTLGLATLPQDAAKLRRN
jgi:hypothetical protein